MFGNSKNRDAGITRRSSGNGKEHSKQCSRQFVGSEPRGWLRLLPECQQMVGRTRVPVPLPREKLSTGSLGSFDTRKRVPQSRISSILHNYFKKNPMLTALNKKLNNFRFSIITNQILTLKRPVRLRDVHQERSSPIYFSPFLRGSKMFF